MAKFRKKPIVIEAEIYVNGLEDGFAVRCDPMNSLPDVGVVIARSIQTGEEYITPVYSVEALKEIAASDPEWLNELVPFINTLEERHFISPSDWIITGVKGERYPCKPDIFEATYEAVE